MCSGAVVCSDKGVYGTAEPGKIDCLSTTQCVPTLNIGRAHFAFQVLMVYCM